MKRHFRYHHPNGTNVIDEHDKGTLLCLKHQNSNSKFNINLKRSSKPIANYKNFSLTIRLILSGDVESNPGPGNECALNRRRKQSKPFPPTCQVCSKIVRANANRLLCIHCNNLLDLKCTKTNLVKK